MEPHSRQLRSNSHHRAAACIANMTTPTNALAVAFGHRPRSASRAPASPAPHLLHTHIPSSLSLCCAHTPSFPPHACSMQSLCRLQRQPWQLLLLDLLSGDPHGVEAVRHTLRQLDLQEDSDSTAQHSTARHITAHHVSKAAVEPNRHACWVWHVCLCSLQHPTQLAKQ